MDSNGTLGDLVLMHSFVLNRIRNRLVGWRRSHSNDIVDIPCVVICRSHSLRRILSNEKGTCAGHRLLQLLFHLHHRYTYSFSRMRYAIRFSTNEDKFIFLRHFSLTTSVQYVHCVMHKCIMVKVGGKRKTHKAC